MATNYGKYKPIRLLGKGASGTVYLAQDTFSGTEVALKVLDEAVVTNAAQDRKRLKQFLNEASLTGRLSHPHIAAILDAAIGDESGYLALEYVSGGDLSQFTLPGALLPVELAIEMAFKSCGALDYAFRQGVIHRDIKPANIMVASGTNIKVVDFGAAYWYDAEKTQIANIGSPGYMSPEQLNGQPLGFQSDMFSLGVVFYELFTGERPFIGKSLAELFSKIALADPLPPSHLRPELPDGIDRMVLTMLCKAPEARYPSWAELALDLADIGRLGSVHNAIPDSERFGGLRRIEVLATLSDAEIWELVYAAQWRRVPARTVLMREGEEGGSLFCLASGEVTVTKNGRLLNMLRAGEYFGEMAYMKAGLMPRQATAETTSEALIAEFPLGVLNGTSKNCQLAVATAMLHALVDRLALSDERITRVTT
jgi:serine/threonine protein kinase